MLGNLQLCDSSCCHRSVRWQSHHCSDVEQHAGSSALGLSIRQRGVCSQHYQRRRSVAAAAAATAAALGHSARLQPSPSAVPVQAFDYDKKNGVVGEGTYG